MRPILNALTALHFGLALTAAGEAARPAPGTLGSGECKCGPNCSCDAGDRCCCDPKSAYDLAYERSVKEGKPLAVFVGQAARRVDGCVCVRWDGFPGVKHPAAVLVSVPSSGGHEFFAVLRGSPDDGLIRSRGKLVPAPPVWNFAFPQQGGCPGGFCPSR